MQQSREPKRFTARPQLSVTADAVSDGLRPSLVFGQMVRVEMGKELKSLVLWGIETVEHSGVSLVIRDGHTLKKKVAWHPTSSNDGEPLNAAAVAFVPAHQYATARVNASVWTTWWSVDNRSFHQIIMFDPVTRQAQKALTFAELFRQIPAAHSLYLERPATSRGVKFAHDRVVVQAPLALHNTATGRVYVVHQVEHAESVDAAIACVVPHAPFTVTDTCRLPFAFAREGSAITRLALDPTGVFLFVVSERLHVTVVAVRGVEGRMQVVRSFRPRDFTSVAKTPLQALSVAMEWNRAETESRVILPEYFLDPLTHQPISEPRRFASAASSVPVSSVSKQRSSSQPTSQRSASLASTIPQRVLTDRPADFADSSAESATAPVEEPHRVTPPTSRAEQLPAAVRPSATVLYRAVETLAHLRATMLLSRYYFLWASKGAKHPSWCIDGWAKRNHPIVALPLELLVGPAVESFLGVCCDAKVEVWLLSRSEEAAMSLAATLREQDVHKVVGQLISIPETVERSQHVCFRHVSHQQLLLLMPTVAWTVWTVITGSDATTCPHKFLCSVPESVELRAALLKKLAAVVFSCHRMASREHHFWSSVDSDELQALFCLAKECSPDGSRFIDLRSLAV